MTSTIEYVLIGLLMFSIIIAIFVTFMFDWFTQTTKNAFFITSTIILVLIAGYYKFIYEPPTLLAGISKNKQLEKMVQYLIK